ncbi:MAG: DJ-1/PfpI family protein [Acidobacteriota bacterium]|nr:DJ-1/PfpI family protein [Acidobacteriota bacterium]
MARVAVMIAPGFEEGEGLAIVDIFRRAEIECDMVGLEGSEVAGGHEIVVRTDVVFDGSLDAYDMVVLPGGYGGADAMRADDRLQAALRTMDAEGRLVCAICAAPIALDRAGILAGRRFTCYPETAPKIEDASATWVDEVVVRDGNLITSQGPATAYAFAYALVDALGVDSEPVKQRMVYYNAFDVRGDE